MTNFNNQYVNCTVNSTNNYNKIRIKGNVNNPAIYSSMLMIASNPIDRMSNYSGSGLPFPCSDIAFENTPNNYIIESSGLFDVEFFYPNSYYSIDGKTKIISSIFFILDMNGKKEYVRFELPDLCILKTLFNRNNRTGPEFYASKDYILPVANAENVMRSYSKIKRDYNIA
jgi:hypothetical protein